MKAWHGSDTLFQEFDTEYLMSGEGTARRGEGINVALDREVAIFYAQRGRVKEGFLYALSVPEITELLDLNTIVSDGVMFILKGAYAFSGVDLDQLFGDAASHDELSMSYPDHAAERQFLRLWTDPYNESAAEELKEWSPGFDWDQVIRVMKNCGLQLNEHSSNHDLLMIAYSHMGADRTHSLLIENGLYGVIGSEPLSEGEPETALSAVIFRSEDVKILEVDQLADHGSEPQF